MNDNSSSCVVPSVPKADFPRDNQTSQTDSQSNHTQSIESHDEGNTRESPGLHSIVTGGESPRLHSEVTGRFTCSYNVTVPLLLLTFRRGPTVRGSLDGTVCNDSYYKIITTYEVNFLHCSSGARAPDGRTHKYGACTPCLCSSCTRSMGGAARASSRRPRLSFRRR